MFMVRGGSKTRGNVRAFRGLLNSKKIEDAWDDVLSEKQMSCFHNWFGRLYECPVDKYNEMRRRYGESHSDW